MPVFGDGLQTRAFSHIADVAPIIARAPLVAASRPTRCSTSAPTSRTRSSSSPRRSPRRSGRAADVEHLPARNEVVHAFSDHAKVRAVFAPPEPIDLRDRHRRAWPTWVKRARRPRADRVRRRDRGRAQPSAELAPANSRRDWPSAVRASERPGRNTTSDPTPASGPSLTSCRERVSGPAATSAITRTSTTAWWWEIA